MPATVLGSAGGTWCRCTRCHSGARSTPRALLARPEPNASGCTSGTTLRPQPIFLKIHMCSDLVDNVVEVRLMAEHPPDLALHRFNPRALATPWRELGHDRATR